jgi:hypothetical protein
MPRRLIFVSFYEKCLFHFSNTKIRFFCETATEKQNRKLGATPHTNIRPARMHISVLIGARKPSEVYFGFCASSCRFRWNRGGFALYRYLRQAPDFWKKNHFSIRNVSFFHGTLTVKAELRTAWQRAGVFRHRHFMRVLNWA